MLELLQSWQGMVGGLAAFGLVMAIWLGGVMLWSRRQSALQDQLRSRISGGGSRAQGTRVLRLWHEGQETTAIVPRHRRGRDLRARLRKTFKDAGFKSSPGSILMVIGFIVAVSMIVGYAVGGNLLVSLAVGGSVVVLAYLVIKHQAEKTGGRFESQLLDALGLASRSLRAGHPLGASFRLIAEEIPAPVGHIFAELSQQQAMGLSLEDSVRQMAEDSHSNDMRLFASSVVVQLRSGGNLADMMDRLAFVMRERMRIRRRFRTLTAQTQFSKRVLLAWPIILFLFINLFKPQYMEPMLHSSTGHLVLGCAVAMFLVGVVVMNRWSSLKT